MREVSEQPERLSNAPLAPEPASRTARDYSLPAICFARASSFASMSLPLDASAEA